MRRLSTLVLFTACTINGKAFGPRAAAPPITAEALPAQSTSMHPVARVVPDLRGLTLADANARVHAAGFLDDVDTEAIGAIPTDAACTDGTYDGRVCGQFPAPGEATHDHRVIAAMIGRHDAYADRLIAPDVHGATVDDARAAFTRAGFTTPPHVEGGACAPGTVCGQHPAAGDRAYRSTMVIFYVGS